MSDIESDMDVDESLTPQKSSQKSSQESSQEAQTSSQNVSQDEPVENMRSHSSTKEAEPLDETDDEAKVSKKRKKDKKEKKHKKSKKEKKQKKQKKQKSDKKEISSDEEVPLKRSKKSVHTTENVCEQSRSAFESEDEVGKNDTEDEILKDLNDDFNADKDDDEPVDDTPASDDDEELPDDATKDNDELPEDSDKENKDKNVDEDEEVNDEEEPDDEDLDEDGLPKPSQVSDDDIDAETDEDMPKPNDSEDPADEDFENYSSQSDPKQNAKEERIRRRKELAKKFAHHAKDTNNLFRLLSVPYATEDGTSSISNDNLINILKVLEAMWSAGDPGDLEELDVLVRKNLGLTVEGVLSPDEVEEAVKRTPNYFVVQLQARFARAKLIDDTIEGQKYFNRLKRLSDLIWNLCRNLYQQARTQFLMMNPDKCLTPGITSVFEWQPKLAADKFKSHQKFLHFVMAKLEEKGLKRDGDKVMKPIWAKQEVVDADGKKTFISHFTHTYEYSGQNIQQFVDSCCDYNVEAEAWGDFTHNMGNRTSIATFLTYANLPCFRDIKKCRYMIAWRNGIHHLIKRKFIPYTAGSDIEAFLRDIDVDPVKPKKRVRSKTDNYELVCATYKDKDFEDFTQTPPGDIPTPHLDSVLDAQFNAKSISQEPDERIETTIKKVKETFISMAGGRSYFEGGLFDDMQVASMLIGRAGVGKSTLCYRFMDTFDRENIGTISNYVETQWAFAGIYGESIFSVWATEVGENFKMDQAELMQAIALEYISVHQKHMTAFGYDWRTHIFFAANKFPRAWKNQGNNLRRRFVISDWWLPVTEKQCSTTLAKDLEKEESKIIQKAAGLYLDMCAENRGKSFWSFCPNYFKINSKKFIGKSDPIAEFIEESDLVLRASEVPNGTVPLWEKIDFRDTFRNWLNSSGRKNPTAWAFKEDDYKLVFEDYPEIKILKNQADWEKEKIFDKYKAGEWFYGIAKNTTNIHFTPSVAPNSYTPTNRDPVASRPPRTDNS
jgi:hypothetical protein